jgi:two-component system, chemotaxis family, protein-glutamate methylesterase/glutaminase
MPTRILIVDDSPLVRQLLREGLAMFSDLEIVGEASDGLRAERMVTELRPDVITMDVVMPMMGGLEAIRSIMARSPTAIVVVASPYQGVEKLAMEAIAAGALDVFPKTADFGGRLSELVRLLREAALSPLPANRKQSQRSIHDPDLRTAIRSAAMIGIVASAGGPQTLTALLRDLPPTFPVPITLVQHTARGFGLELANWLDGQLAIHVREGRNGERVRPGEMVVAPDDVFMEIAIGGAIRIVPPPKQLGVPLPGTALLRSIANVHGPRGVGIVLTGMGSDGAEGLQQIEQRSGVVIIQEPGDAMIRGMPSRALERTVAPVVATLADLARLLRGIARP